LSPTRKRLVKIMNIKIPKEEIADFCRKWKIAELSLFGSVLRDDFRPDSDIDLLVTFSRDAEWRRSCQPFSVER